MESGSRSAWRSTVLVGAGVLLFGLASYGFREALPTLRPDRSFSWFAFAVSGIASALFLLVGLSFLRHFRHNREPILFILALAMLLFSESSLLFLFSRLWDFTWWMWHWIRAVVFVGILFGLAYEFAESVRDLDASQARLVESARLASLGEMAAGVAHEIRNPLATITSCLGLLRDGKVSEDEAREIMEILQREVNRLNHIVADTMSFARPRRTEHRPVALEAVVREALRNALSSHRAIKLRCAFDPDLPPVMGDPDGLQQIIWNLADNATAAMNYCGEIAVEGWRRDGRIVLSVADSGPGIPEEIQSKVCQPFLSTKPDGTGLGLSIVERIVADHGGRMQIQSQIGTGTRVLIEFPLPELTPASVPESARSP